MASSKTMEILGATLKTLITAWLWYFILFIIDIILLIVGRSKRKQSTDGSNSSTISVDYMEQVIEKLKSKRVRSSTANNYLTIWRLFNRFIIRLDRRPPKWEDRAVLFCAYLVDSGYQSATVKYISAIKATLRDDGYIWQEESMLISALTQACKVVNDRVSCRLTIQCGLMEMILFEIKRKFSNENQPYLETMYCALFALAYYGLMRISELVVGSHTIKAKNIHVAENKDKMLLMLYSSKTHGKESLPQKIKIQALGESEEFRSHRFFCPFQLVREFLLIRGGYESEFENLFIFRDKCNVQQNHVRSLHKELLSKLNLEPSNYGFHSFRVGRTVDMAKMKISLEKIKEAGRWQSNAVYRYLKT